MRQNETENHLKLREFKEGLKATEHHSLRIVTKKKSEV